MEAGGTISMEEKNLQTDFTIGRFMDLKKELVDTIKDTNKELKDVMRDGFKSVSHELQVSREQGHIPIGVMEKILTSNNEANRTTILSITEANKENRKSSDEAYTRILKTVCWMMGVILVWVTGMKVWLPDAQELVKKIAAPKQVIEKINDNKAQDGQSEH